MATVEGFQLDGLALNSYPTGGIYLLQSIDFTPAKKRPEWAENADGDGSLLIRDPLFENSQWDAVVEVRAASRDLAHTAVGAITAKLEEAERNVLGVPLVWTPADSSKGLTFYVLTGEVTEIPLTHESGYFASPAPVLAVGLSLTCRPFGYGAEVTTLTDGFGTDTIGSGLWDVQGIAGISVSGGKLISTASPNSDRLLRRTDWRVYDSEITVTHKTPAGPFAATYVVGVILKYIDANNYMYARMTEDGAGRAITIRKKDAGVDANLQTLTAPAALSAATTYKFRARVEGNKVTVEHLDSAGAALTGGGSFTLTAGDITKFGTGVDGNPGIYWRPFQTSAEMDDFSVTPNVYVKASGEVANITPPIYGVEGDVPAEARLVVTDTAGQNRDLAIWGLEYRYYNGSDLTLTQPDLTATGFAGSSTTRAGSVSTNIYRGTLTTSPVAVCGTGNQPHVGTFRPYLRCYPTSTGVRVRFTYREGDGPLKSLEWETPVAANAWNEIDLGVISIPEKLLGTQRWTGQIEAYTDTPGDALDVDYLILVPAGEGYGRARREDVLPTPTSFIARDEFDQSAGSLTGKTAPVGGVYTGAGSATDLATTGSGTVTRSTTGDADISTGRYVLSGATALAGSVAQIDISRTSNNTGSGHDQHAGVLLRYVDTSNWLKLVVVMTGSGSGAGEAPSLQLIKRVAGTVTTIASESLTLANLTSLLTTDTFGIGGTYRVKLAATAKGSYVAYYGPSDSELELKFHGNDPDLAGGGALASGKVGIYDASIGGGISFTRTFDNLLAYPVAADAVCWSGQSIEFRSDDTLREDSTGTYYGRPSEYRGAPFFLPPAGDENRASRVVAFMRRNDIYTQPATNPTDNQTIEVKWTPRYLYLPR